MKAKELATNKRAFYDYEILETIEAGIELLGHEVKSAKGGHCHLRGAFVHLRNDEAWLTNSFIAPYAKASHLTDYDPTRSRRLLLRRRDLHRLIGKHGAERLTIVPLRLYVRHGLVKVEIALARGKRKYEKRETIKRREDERRMRRATMQ
ncbi:MAG: SsrA-binding protein SmpB [Candidatus Uhrbacteria bacterium]